MTNYTCAHFKCNMIHTLRAKLLDLSRLPMCIPHLEDQTQVCLHVIGLFLDKSLKRLYYYTSANVKFKLSCTLVPCISLAVQNKCYSFNEASYTTKLTKYQHPKWFLHCLALMHSIRSGHIGHCSDNWNCKSNTTWNEITIKITKGMWIIPRKIWKTNW